MLKQVANDDMSSHAMAKEEALQDAKSAASQLRDTGSSDKSVDAELPLAIDKHITARGSTTPQEGLVARGIVEAAEGHLFSYESRHKSRMQAPQ